MLSIRIQTFLGKEMPVASQEICTFPFHFRATFNTKHSNPISQPPQQASSFKGHSLK